MIRKIAFKTLGCRLNQFETNSLVSEFTGAGYQVVDFNDPADIYVVNTCTVTGQSDKKSRNLISQAAKTNNNAMVIAAGCMITNPRIEHPANRNVTYYVENTRKSSIFSLVEAHFEGEIMDPLSFEPDVFSYKPAKTTLLTRSLIKIQDGCDNYCTFCIVPFVRGRAISRPVPDILDNIRKVLEFGFKEIVVTGVNIGRYQWEGTSFEDLVAKILDIPGDFRVRISSMEPEGFGDKFIELFSNPKLMPHLHLCVQSGSDQVLLRMRRIYNLQEYLNIIDKVRGKYADFNFTTDIIVGFPGETDEDFQASCKVVRDAGFSHIHTFRYSRRKGTRADRMPGQVPYKIKNERSEIIRKISEENKRSYRSSLIGKTQTVLVEKVNGNSGLGYGELYVPVEFTHPGMKNNMLQEVKLTGIHEGEDPVLIGTVKSDLK
ncbi:MAG: tRNA (N(6)-L-threonylcarbamoyladenosine(37)-C(2))-methylthiotransferase MtaB [Bacteroidales bacterium]|nr:tRNA (N(6)-L-threonylcarbamoyladenosine(37)-C(2))-methylthiotransferase MtaB [Bacteroidales bacterium]